MEGRCLPKHLLDKFVGSSVAQLRLNRLESKGASEEWGRVVVVVVLIGRCARQRRS